MVVSRGDLNGTSGCNCACQLPSVEGLTVQIGSLSGPECSHAIVKGMVIYLIAAVMGSELTVGFCQIWGIVGYKRLSVGIGFISWSCFHLRTYLHFAVTTFYLFILNK